MNTNTHTTPPPLPLSRAAEPCTRVVRLAAGSRHVVQMEAPTASEQNSAVMVLFCGDAPLATSSGSSSGSGNPYPHKEEVTLSLLAQLIREPAFTTLRTRGQLGYIVSAFEMALGGGRGGTVGCIGLKVLSKTHAPAAVETKALDFLATFSDRYLQLKEEETAAEEGGEGTEKGAAEGTNDDDDDDDDDADAGVVGITAGEFAKAKAALSAKLLQPPKRLANESAQWWGEVQFGDEQWGRYEHLAEALESVSLGDVRDLYRRLVLDPATRRHFSAHVHCRKHPIVPLEPDASGRGVFTTPAVPLTKDEAMQWRAAQPLFAGE
jgi:secreted Zn-dependent insulinase-like peptidase